MFRNIQLFCTREVVELRIELSITADRQSLN